MNSETINFSFIPASTINSASSRLRCFGLARELQKLGYETNFDLNLVSKSHILFVQKIVSAKVSELVKSFKSLGGLVIYDIDDYGELALGSLKASPEVFSDFMSSVSIVTVDTVFRKNFLSQDLNYKNIKDIWVIPDPIDYIENLGEIVKHNDSPESFQCCWFGNAPNIIPAIPYLSCLSTSPYVSRVIAITNSEYVDDFKNSYPFMITVPWTLDGFPSLMRQIDFCVLAHDNSVAGGQKSNNKMLAAIALGVVPFVSRTNSYELTAKELNIPELIIDSPQDLIDRLKPTVFNGIREKIFSNACRNKLLENSPETVARIFIVQLGRYIQNNMNSQSTQNPIKLNTGIENTPLQEFINVNPTSERGDVVPDVICEINSDLFINKKILIVCSHFWPSIGGIESRLGQFSDELIKYGYQVTILTSELPNRTSHLYNGIEIQDVKLGKGEFREAIREFISSGIFQACIIVQDPLGEIIWGLEGLIPPLCTKVFIQPVINEDGFSKWKNDPSFCDRLSKILTDSGTAITMTRSGPDHYFMENRKIPHFFIPNATTPEKIFSDFRGHFGIAKTDFVILHVANLWRVKNHTGLLNALSNLPSHWKLVLIGHPSGESDYVQSVMEALKIRSDVLYVPGLSKEWVASAMQAADVIVLASLGEGSPNTILEAMSHQRPWIATPRCGAANDHLGGFICELSEFKNQLKLLDSNPEWRGQIGQIGYKHWSQCYS